MPVTRAAAEVAPGLGKGFASRTGRYLFDVLQPLGQASIPEVDVHYHSVDAKRDLLALLDRIAEEMLRDHRTPLIHIEAHGEDRSADERISRGIVSGNEEPIFWEELVPALSKINTASRLNLLVFMASCFGSDFTAMVDPLRPAPARLIVGPPNELSIGDVQDGTEAFYLEFFRSKDGNAAVREMRKAIAPAKVWAIETVWLFKETMSRYFATEGSNDSISARASRILLTKPVEFLPHDKVDSLRSQVRAAVGDHERLFEQARRAFFSLDLFPENADRFPVTLAECLAHSATPSRPAGRRGGPTGSGPIRDSLKSRRKERAPRRSSGLPSEVEGGISSVVP